MKLSIDLPGALPAREYVEIARLVEEHGFDEIHVFDDLMARPVWPILTLIGEHTERLKVGPAIVSPQIVHPAYQAANLAELDELTGGRAVSALGRGAFFDWVGLPPPQKPLTMLREAVAIMRRLLAGDRTPFHGEVFEATEDLALQFPARPDVPILLGTWSPRTCELAGEVADGFYAGNLADPAYLSMLRGRLHAGAVRAGRDPSSLEVAISPVFVLGPDRATAADAIRPIAAHALDWLHPMTEAAGVTDAQMTAIRAAFAAGDPTAAAPHLTDTALDFFALTGTPDDVIPRLHELVAAGADHVAFSTLTPPNFAEIVAVIANEIAPALRG